MVLRPVMLAIAAMMLFPAVDAQAPATVYEEPDIPPQAMDFDAENNRFRAHSGWLDDKLIHYYKFRMYVPPNYGTNDGGLAKVPIAPLYLPTTDGTLSGVPDGQQPIVRFHTADGTSYSDFMELVLVDVADDYVANSHKSAAAVMAAGTPAGTGILLNVPVVPLGSTLEDPVNMGSDAPIDPWMAWYEGNQIQTFVFETTHAAVSQYINDLTRTRAPAGGGYESVVAQFGTTSGISAIPIWHINQYQAGVTQGLNNGGPSAIGQRNVIDKDRLDAGYSPLWQVWWATQVPANFNADEASHASQFTEENGFKIAKTPMYVNCPNIGPHGGGEKNTNKKASFDAQPDVGAHRLDGSIPMQEGVALDVVVDGTVIDSISTGMMGLFSYQLSAQDAGKTVEFVTADGNSVATFSFGEPDAAGSNKAILIGAGLVGVVVIFLMLRRAKA